MLTKEHSLTKNIIFMRKIYLAWALLLSAIGVQAQEYNLFPASVVDENGWLWFNSQNIVDQYVGVCNEDDYKVDPEGRVFKIRLKSDAFFTYGIDAFHCQIWREVCIS
ncbi:MAG: hypothetical protein EGR43_07885, partial [Prevotella sp.]|nr:hypothetical protein [Prevotella sp.]